MSSNLDDPISISPQDYGPASPLLTEADFHRQTQSLAEALMNSVITSSGTILPDVDPVRVEKALSAAKQVIDAIRRARSDLRQAHEDQQFEKAVITAAKKLPTEAQNQFLENLETELRSATAYDS